MESQSLLASRPLLIAIKSSLERRKTTQNAFHSEARRILAILDTVPLKSVRLPKSAHAITGQIGHLPSEDEGREHPPLGDVTRHLPYLPWTRTEGDSSASSHLTQRAANANIIGPGALFPREDIFLGLTLIAPNTLCPSHHHPDAELCHPLMGGATWIIGGVARKLAPRDVIVSPPQAVHAIHTDHQPVLALFVRLLSPAETPPPDETPPRGAPRKHEPGHGVTARP